jgi:hypothetical protein
VRGTGTIGKEMHSKFFMEIMKEKHYPDDLICERNMKIDIKEWDVRGWILWTRFMWLRKRISGGLL